MGIRSRLRSRSYGAGGSAPPAFVPTDIAGLQLWLDASDTASITHTANSVSQWNDKSGNSRHATQGTATNQPTTNTTTINSLNAISFDGSNDRLVMNSGIHSITGGQNTAFIVIDSENRVDLRNIVRGRVTTDADERFGISTNSGTTFVARNGTSNATDALTGAITDNYILVNHASSVLNAYVNGGVAGGGGGFSSGACDQMVIGGYSATNDAQAYAGRIGEIIMYNSALSTADLNRVGNYLATKWGITWTNI